MSKLYREGRKPGNPPGTLMPSKKFLKAQIDVIDYTATQLDVKTLESIEESFPYRDTSTVSWININRTDVEAIKKVGVHFGIHSLVLEDIVNVGQRPKVEDYGEYLFFVLKMITLDEETHEIDVEQISLILGKNFVISFQEKPGDVFDSIRLRIRESKGRIRKLGSDYLAYRLLDAIVDYYFLVLEKIGERIDALEEKLLRDPKADMHLKIYKLKRYVILLRKQIWPLREVLSNFQRTDSPLIQETTGVYLQDVYDHTIQVNDTLEAFRDAISGLHDIYLSSVSNRMNEIMKVLTIFAAIFIPLTFLAGIYGMNFENMPELHTKYGYFILLGVMAMVGIGMAMYFKNKKWL